MSVDWVQDITDMHEKFGVNDWMFVKLAQNDMELLKKYLAFRIAMCNEEMTETQKALAEGDAEGIVDGLIDLCVFAIGTLNVMGVDAHEAWNRVHTANMAKVPGVKPNRPNPFGLPDLIKPESWLGPCHEDNHGYISKIINA